MLLLDTGCYQQEVTVLVVGCKILQFTITIIMHMQINKYTSDHYHD